MSRAALQFRVQEGMHHGDTKGTERNERQGGRKRNVFASFSFFLCALCVSAVSFCAGCVTTEMKVRVPKDVAMARAFVRGSGFGVQGSGTAVASERKAVEGRKQKAEGGEKRAGGDALSKYLTERQRTERYEAVGDTVTDSIGNIMSALSPFAMISAISGHWARVAEANQDCELVEWKFTDSENTPDEISANLEYDANDRPRMRVDVKYGAGGKKKGVERGE
jgi:hypothetical protein